jgi:indole-3-glycerol phosphate synthase
LTGAIPDILSQIVARKREELAGNLDARAALEAKAERARTSKRDFEAALGRGTPALITEIKRASPSKGVLAPGIDPARVAVEYEQGGAAALSVLTDETFFRGSLSDLRAARDAVAIPALRKDFTIDEYHVIEAAASGADAVLLIVAILTERQIRAFQELAGRYGMAAVVEVHDAAELDIALAAGARIVGVNNRDLRTFEVTLETSLRLAERIPSGILKVSESGIRLPEDVCRLRQAGYQAFLVGEHLITAPDRAAAVRALAGAR